MNSSSKIPKKLRRISGDEAASCELLVLTALTREASELTQKRAFKNLMPSIYVIRTQKGLTFKEITSILKDVGLQLSESTVRAYYNEFILLCEKECKSKLVEYVQLLDEIQMEYPKTKDLTLREIVQMISDRKFPRQQ